MTYTNPEGVCDYIHECQIKAVDVGLIDPNPDNPRKDLGDLQEMTDSVKAFGILQNLTITTGEEKGRYVVVCGHRRLAAAKEAGLEKVPCRIVPDMDKKTQIGIMLQENMTRGDLNYQEEAQAFQMMMDLGDSIADIVKKTGLSETKIRHRIKLNELDQDKLEEAMGRNVTINDLILLEQIKDQKQKNLLLDKIGTNGFEWAVESAIKEEKKEMAKTQLQKMLPSAEFTANWSQYPSVCSLRYGDVNMETLIAFAEELLNTAEDAGVEIQIMMGYQEITGRIKREPDRSDARKNDPQKEAENRRREKRKNDLRGMKERIDERVCKWIGKITEEKAKKKEEQTLPRIVEWMANGYVDADPEEVMETAGVQVPEEEEAFNEAWRKACAEEPHRMLLLVGFMSMLPPPYQDWWGYEGEYSEERTEGIKAAYSILQELGYAASDEELDFIHGRSDMYFTKEESK